MPKQEYATGRAVSFRYGRTGTGIEQIGVSIEIKTGTFEGATLPWYGFLNSDENIDRTLESLRALGWDGEDPLKLNGLGSKAAQVTIDEEEYEGTKRTRIAWVNAPGVPMKESLDDKEQSALAKRLNKRINNR